MSLQGWDGEENRIRADAILIIRQCHCGSPSPWVPCANPGEGTIVTLTGGLELHCGHSLSEVEARIREAQRE